MPPPAVAGLALECGWLPAVAILRAASGPGPTRDHPTEGVAGCIQQEQLFLKGGCCSLRQRAGEASWLHFPSILESHSASHRLNLARNQWKRATVKHSRARGGRKGQKASPKGTAKGQKNSPYIISLLVRIKQSKPCEALMWQLRDPHTVPVQLMFVIIAIALTLIT